MKNIKISEALALLDQANFLFPNELPEPVPPTIQLEYMKFTRAVDNLVTRSAKLQRKLKKQDLL